MNIYEAAESARVGSVLRRPLGGQHFSKVFKELNIDYPSGEIVYRDCGCRAIISIDDLAATDWEVVE